ncbi:protein of unknown function DUF262 [Vibrio phage 1.054.O._10N.261.52.A1]|nr:protein of unknown function DUF262 [Vibrio phage 1.054.O._10N.261.52.A1]
MVGIIEKLRSNTRASAFNRQGYRVSFEVGGFYRTLRFYSEVSTEGVEDCDLIKSITPEFQRNNDKWSKERKIKFVENVLSGYPSEITLFTVGNDLMDDCGILDGQQRLTAIQDWFDGRFPIYGDIYYSQMSHIRRVPFIDCRLSLVIHNFKSTKEAVRFYIDINEGITHSNEDIEKAKNYLESIK